MFVVSLFTFGSMNTILMKVQFTMFSIGKTGEEEQFTKPAVGTLNMFLSMSLILIPYYIMKSRSKKKIAPDASPRSAPLLAPGAKSAKTPMPWWKTYLCIAVPSTFDLVATALCMVGIMYIPASVWQMLRGAEIVFAAILTVVVLRRPLYGFHWFGVAFCTAGIVAVGYAATAASAEAKSSADPAEDAAKAGMVLLGITLTLVGQIVQAGQIIAEEHLLEDMDMEPLLIVGVEGLWGTLVMLLVVYPVLWIIPGSDHGHAEDGVDTLALIKNSSTLMAMTLGFMFSCATYNVSGMLVTSALSGVMRVMLEATRTLCIWVFGLAWHYGVNPDSSFGEAWTNWSFLQLFGFFLLMLGQATYGEKIRWPCFYYPPAEEVDQSKFISPGAVRAGAFASPGRKLTELPSETGNGVDEAGINRVLD